MKKASFPVFLIYGIIASLGFFNSPSVNTILKLAVVLPLVAFAVLYGNWYLHREKASGVERIIFGLLSLTLVKVVFLYLTSARLDSFPLDILILVVLTTVHPLSDAIIYTAATAAINLVHAYSTGEQFSGFDNLYRVFGLFSTVVIVGRLLQFERKARVKAEGLWGGVESLARNIAVQAKDRNGASLAIADTDNERLFIDSAGELNSSIKGTLETISRITGAHSCCLFIFKGDSFALSSVAFPNNGLIYEIPREKGKSFISWIEEYDRPLLIDRLPDYKALGYYSEDAGVKHFLGVPVAIKENNTRGVLCVDRKDAAFTKHDENLLTLAASAIAVFLKNSNNIGRMRVEAKEFSVFYQMVKRLSNTLVVDDILTIAMNFSKEIKEYDLTTIALIDDKGDLKFMSARGDRAADLLNDNGERGREFLEWIMEKGVSNQFLVSRMEKKFVQKLPRPLDRMGSFLCIPLIVSTRSIGLFITARRHDTPYSAYEIKLFEALSAHVSVAVSNAEIYKRMQDMATKDGLTGLYNHRSFQDRLSHEIERGARYNQSLSLILLDIDFFKKVNDTYGHPAGDKVLKGISSILAASIRELDLAARYGGEEFAIILINSDARHAYTIADRIRARIEAETFDIGDGKKLRITSSMGIAAYPGDGDNQSRLVSNADSALYRAKKDGRNRVYMYSQHSMTA